MVKNVNRVRAGGFALVATISILSLLVLVVVAMLSLSVIEQRSSVAQVGLDEAKANARLALTQALSELQKNAGPDTRITASADAVAGGNGTARNLTGVWRSWEGLDHDKTHGLPHAYVAGTTTPIYDLKTQTGAHDDANDNGRFLSWLVSSYDSNTHNANAPVVLSQNTDTVPLLADGSLPVGSADEVHVVPTGITEGTQQQGSYAWWVTGNNSKAYIRNEKADATTIEDIMDHRVTAGVAEAGEFDFAETGSAGDELPRMHSRDSFDLASTNGDVDFNSFFFDMTHTANGLLTNTANGGWRRDFSLFTDYIYDPSGLDRIGNGVDKNVFTLDPQTVRTSDTTYGVAEGSTTINDGASTDGTLYPWLSLAEGATHHLSRLGVISWNGIAEHANLYRRLSNGGQTPLYDADVFQHSSSNALGNNESVSGAYGMNVARIQPVLSRVDWVFYLYTKESSSSTPTSKTYDLYVKIKPAIVMWNPYNVAIEYDLSTVTQTNGSGGSVAGPGWPNLGFSWSDATFNDKYFPFDLIVEVGDQEQIIYNMAELTGKTSGSNRKKTIRSLNLDITKSQSLILRPGENKIFGTLADTSNSITATNTLEPNFDFDPSTGLDITLKNVNGESADGSSILQLASGLSEDSVKMSMRYRNYKSTTSPTDVMEMEYYWNPYGGNKNDRKVVVWTSNEHEVTYETAFQTLPLPLSDGYLPFPGNETLGSLEGGVTDAYPFLLASMGQRPIQDTGGADFYRRTKGYYNSDFISPIPRPFGSYSNLDLQMGWALSSLDGTESSAEMLQTDVGVASGDDSAFMVTTHGAGGISRWSAARLALKPFNSLGDLANVDLAPEVSYPPYATDAFANSSASTLIHQESVFLGYGRTLDANQNEIAGGSVIKDISEVSTIALSDIKSKFFFGTDHSYCTNHLLFDDWFVSSITNKTDGISNTISKNAENVYRDHLTGAEPLVNEYYKPRKYLTDAEANAKAGEVNVGGASYDEDHYLNMAADLKVEGMFNINSTSYKAWASILKSLKGLSQIKAAYTATSWELSDEAVDADKVAFTRTPAMVSDDEANASSQALTSGGVMTDEMIYDDGGTPDDLSDDKGLAVEIVNQIKLRGPFLSLSEFVNRQLSDNDDLALSGAVESALHELSLINNADENPFHALQNAFPEQSTSRTVETGAMFPKASEGYAIYGYPGWIRQADIIKGMAPIMTARDDSFTIRAYGSSIDSNGDTVRVWCEAVVERIADYVDPADDNTEFGDQLTPLNQKYGRKFVIKSFSWLDEDEV